MTQKTQKEINDSGITTEDLISHFREKCSICGHHRIMHDSFGKCEGVMNKPCNSGCDEFNPE
jgi:hypothetical protein